MEKKKMHPLITGTIILTATGLITRTIGFFYRIYLARIFGEEGMGIYQLLGPVTALSFSLTAAGFQTAISKLTAEASARSDGLLRPMLTGLTFSLPLSAACALFVYTQAPFIGTTLLGEPRTAPMLRILAFSIPFCAVHACCNGCFYGRKKTAVPAAAQLLEQFARVGCVYLLTNLLTRPGQNPPIAVAVCGLVAGELTSMLVTLAGILGLAQSSPKKPAPAHPSGTSLYRPLLALALPLTANRIVLNLLQSVESVSIPSRLRLYGYRPAEALSVYGVLTGMAMPLIFFPNALTGSVAVLLLPLISENYASGNLAAVRKLTLRTCKYGGLLGFGCMVFFLLTGGWIGDFLFDSALAGHFIKTLGFLCPFLYLDTTLSSILQGLGLAGRLFAVNVVCLLLRLSFVLWAVPVYGITGCLWGMLASQLLQCLLYLWLLYRHIHKHRKKG